MSDPLPPDLDPMELLLRLQPQATWVGERLEVLGDPAHVERMTRES